MAQIWEFANKGEDCTPEIILKAQNPITSGEKVLLFNVMNGCFGKPVILSGTQSNGQASEVVIGFDGDGVSGINNIMSRLNQSTMDVTWTKTKIRELVISNKIVKITSLMVIIPNNEWNLIKDLNPTLIIERYKPAAYKGFNVNNVQEYRYSGYRKRSDGLSEFPLTSEKQFINIRQEHFFDFTNPQVKSSGVPFFKIYQTQNGTDYKAWQYLRLRIEVSINNQSYISEPFKYLKMVAHKSKYLNFYTIGYQIG